MKFDIDKCSVLNMKRGKAAECDGIVLGNSEEFGQVGEWGYKYLAILKKGDTCEEEMKKNIWKEYFFGNLVTFTYDIPKLFHL